MSAQSITHTPDKYYFDSELLLNFCEDIQATQNDQSKSLLEDKLSNLESIWHKIYESFRAVMISEDSSITPDMKYSIRENFDDNTELYYQGQARLVDLIKRLDNPVSLRFQSTSRYSRRYLTSSSRNFHNDPQRSSNSKKMLKNSECGKTISSLEEINEDNLQKSSQDCLSDETLDSETEVDKDCSSSTARVLINPTETQLIQASGISMASPDTHSPHLQICYEKSSAESLTAFSQAVGRGDLPLRVETVKSKSSLIAFRPPEDECSIRPTPNLSDDPTDFEATQPKKHPEMGHFLAFLKQKFYEFDALTPIESSIPFHHRFTLRWLNYLKFLPKHQRWKDVLTGGSALMRNQALAPDE